MRQGTEARLRDESFNSVHTVVDSARSAVTRRSTILPIPHKAMSKAHPDALEHDCGKKPRWVSN